jgi:hypothetical protein
VPYSKPDLSLADGKVVGARRMRLFFFAKKPPHIGEVEMAVAGLIHQDEISGGATPNCGRNCPICGKNFPIRGKNFPIRGKNCPSDGSRHNISYSVS